MSTTRSQFIFFTTLVVIFTLLSPSLSEKCHQSDKKALLKIKNALNNPYDLIQWTSDTDCCEWYGVKCDERTHRVIDIDISQVDLQLLPIPAHEISHLPRLQSLTFHHTNLSGPVPQSLSKLINLKSLDLRNNHLTGPVPEFLSQLKDLEYIGLSFNSLSGSIPASLSELPNLSGILLDRNQLTGTIPESFGELKAQDIFLYLSHNQPSGEISESLGNAAFDWIDLSRNKLEGDIAFLYGKKKTMRTIDLSRNQLEFDFSNFEFPENLVNLDLNHNKIYGSLPQDLANFDGLISLNVSYNRLCGKIPVGGRLQEFDTTVYFHNKCLCGSPLPDCKQALRNRCFHKYLMFN